MKQNKLNAIAEYVFASTNGEEYSEVDDFNIVADYDNDASIKRACIDCYQEHCSASIVDIEILYVKRGWGTDGYERRF